MNEKTNILNKVIIRSEASFYKLREVMPSHELRSLFELVEMEYMKLVWSNQPTLVPIQLIADSEGWTLAYTQRKLTQLEEMGFISKSSNKRHINSIIEF